MSTEDSVHPEYSQEEFVFQQYYTDAGSAIRIVHSPSGKRTPPVFTNGILGSALVELWDNLMADLIRQLWEEGIPPQPRRVAVKRLGKPRRNKQQ